MPERKSFCDRIYNGLFPECRNTEIFQFIRLFLSRFYKLLLIRIPCHRIDKVRKKNIVLNEFLSCLFNLSIRSAQNDQGQSGNTVMYCLIEKNIEVLQNTSISAY